MNRKIAVLLALGIALIGGAYLVLAGAGKNTVASKEDPTIASPVRAAAGPGPIVSMTSDCAIGGRVTKKGETSPAANAMVVLVQTGSPDSMASKLQDAAGRLRVRPPGNGARTPWLPSFRMRPALSPPGRMRREPGDSRRFRAAPTK